MKERDFQNKLIKEIKEMFPGCFVLKNDANYIQGIPDLTILYQKHWAMLEVKRSKDASHQPNQDEYISKADNFSFGRFIYPGNKEAVLSELQRSFES